MSTATQMAVLTPVLIGFAGLAVDTAWLQTGRVHLQDVADGAALAGVPKLGDSAAVRAAVQEVGLANGLAGEPVAIADADIDIGDWDGVDWTSDPAGDFVRVTARRPGYSLFLGGMFGVPTADIVVEAIAGRAACSGGTWPCAMFADRGFEFNGSAVVTGYDSTTGLPAVPAVCGNMTAVALQGNYELHGDLHPGPDGVVTVGNSAILDGDTTPLPEEVVLPRVAFPATGRTFPRESQGNNVVTLTGGTPYRMPEGFSVNGNARIVINNGPVEIYARGTVTLNGGGIVNTTGNPHNLIIHVVGAGSVHVNGNSAFYGVIDAPDSEVELNGNADFYGALTGGVVHHNGNQDVFLDTSLAASQGTEVSAPCGASRLVR